MRRFHPLITGTLLLTAVGFFCRILGFFYRIFLSRTIGAEGLGLYQMIFPIHGIAVAQGLSVYAVFAFICILRAYYQRSPFRFYTILHRFRLSVNMQMNRIRFCLRMPHNTSVFRCRLCSNHNTVPMIRLALK